MNLKGLELPLGTTETQGELAWARLYEAAPTLLAACKGYLAAQSRMLDRWADASPELREELWRDLHACENIARAAILLVEKGCAH